ncbi:unnamed protein product [Adineta steineri]|uniref:Peroxidase n=1 Tax=Adineta steineri TaxID=433720 RepID=A0A815YMJ8_9BILA|nr:unnamed protein product [Adineta steineri]CAF1573757.1 unnamed protein product [Adineta steineri]
MKVILFLTITFIFTIINGQQHDIPQHQETFFHEDHLNNILDSHDNDNNDHGIGFERHISIPYPQCFRNKLASSFLKSDVLEHIFKIKLEEEDAKLTKEHERNLELHNDDILDFEEMQLRSDAHNGALLARSATKAADELIYQLSCITNASITPNLDKFLKTIQLPSMFCAYQSNPSCEGLTNYRTVTGVCNSLSRPYRGSSQTAYGRLLPPVYDDGLRLPRSESVVGGPLPPCRQVSLAFGSKPTFDSAINNLWVTYGQFLVHDLTFATPVTDSGRTPITSCNCDSKDTDMCNVIDIAPNDPFMAGQRCVAVPATAQAFSDQICALGVKEQVNGNSHYVDLSVTYGSTRRTAASIRVGTEGLMKTTLKPEFKYDLPPGQREGRSCVDSTETNKCFAGGDSRLMENPILSGVQAQWLRIHNEFARELNRIRSDWNSNDNTLYEESKKIATALHQHYTYNEWLPTLVGKTAIAQYLGDKHLHTEYNPSMPGVVFNEVAAAALRLHTFVRDLISRCKPNGDLIDQLWFNEVASKCKFAYDVKTNGLDSFLCGALVDFSFAADTNYAQQIHHRLFESTNHQGELRRSDLVALNICRGRQHGLPGYNAYRQLCGFRLANRFQDFSDTMSPQSIETMQTLYKHPDDVDLFAGLNHETHTHDALVGPVSVCLIGIQFKHLKYGDRFFYTHHGEFTKAQLHSIKNYSYRCFLCHTVDIEKVARNPFQPPNDITNPLESCSTCSIFDFGPWHMPKAS